MFHYVSQKRNIRFLCNPEGITNNRTFNSQVLLVTFQNKILSPEQDQGIFIENHWLGIKERIKSIDQQLHLQSMRYLRLVLCRKDCRSCGKGNGSKETTDDCVQHSSFHRMSHRLHRVWLIHRRRDSKYVPEEI